MKIVDELQPGTAVYAHYLADYLTAPYPPEGPHDGRHVASTDVDLCAAALRRDAGRPHRRAGFALAVAAVFATVALVGVSDRNGDGRVDIADLWLGARAILAGVPAALCAAVASIKEHRR